MNRWRMVLAGIGWVLLACLCIAAPLVPLAVALIVNFSLIVLRELAPGGTAEVEQGTAGAVLAAIVGAVNTVVRRLTLGFAAAAAFGVVAMMAITCMDVIGRIAGRPLIGALDLVSIAMVFTIAGALPYTTAVKGHVAVEYFFQKLSRPWRIIVDTATRLVVIALFALLWCRCVLYGVSLMNSGEVTLTLGIPVFWLMWVIAASCGLVALVILFNLFHPGREMIEP